MKFKKIISLVLAASLTLSMVGCSSNNSSNDKEDSAAIFTSGTYTASQQGKIGTVTAEVTMDESSIKDIKITEQNETAGLGDTAMDKIVKEILENQTVAVDTVAGATVSSEAIINIVKDCIEQAGAKAEDFSSQVAAKPGEDITLDTDLVVIGAGAAGMTAAVTASANGADVVVLEKGSSVAVSNGAMAGGPIAVNTTAQKEAGEDLTLEELYEYMYNYSQGTVNASLLYNVLENTTEAIDIFEKTGATITLRNDNFGVGFRARLKIAEKAMDRMGSVQELAESQGTEFVFDTTGMSLIQDENGKVVGVNAQKSDGTKVTVNAKAVLVCTGGYLGNEEMIKEYLKTTATVNPLGNQLSTGDGINMILEAGGVTEQNFSLVSNEFGGYNSKAGTTGLDREQDCYKFAIYGGLFVNSNGNRFMNEELMATLPLSEGGQAVLREGKYYVILDEEYVNACQTEGIFSYLGSPSEWIMGKNTLDGAVLDLTGDFDKAVEQGWAYKADTLEEIADKFGLENLVETVNAYNEACANKVDTKYGKSSYFLTPVDSGSYYVFEYETSAWCTLGGVKCDDQLRPVTIENEAIEGLWVAGVDAGSMYSMPYYSNEGSAFGLALASGVTAAESITEYLKTIE